MNPKRTIISALVALGLLFGNIMLMQSRIDQAKDQIKKKARYRLRPPNAAAVKVAALGYSELVADVYWLRAIQYTGTMIQLKRVPKDLIPAVDFITELDPRFEFPYIFLGVFLTLERGDGQGIERVLLKGRRALPKNWKIAFHLGFTQYYLLQKYEEAAQNLDVAAQLSGYSYYSLLASRIRAEGGSPELSIAFLEQVLEKTEDSISRHNLERRIQELLVTVHLKFLNQKLAQYQELHGRPAGNWEDLFRAGLLRPQQMPAHPLGGSYFINSKTGRAESTIQVYEGVYRPKNW